MSLSERNEVIIEKFQEKIDLLGLSGKLKMYPIRNTFTRRNHFMKDDSGICFFTAFLWQLNKLSDKELDIDISQRIKEARIHFNL